MASQGFVDCINSYHIRFTQLWQNFPWILQIFPTFCSCILLYLYFSLIYCKLFLVLYLFPITKSWKQIWCIKYIPMLVSLLLVIVVEVRCKNPEAMTCCELCSTSVHIRDGVVNCAVHQYIRGGVVYCAVYQYISTSGMGSIVVRLVNLHWAFLLIRSIRLNINTDTQWYHVGK